MFDFENAFAPSYLSCHRRKLCALTKFEEMHWRTGRQKSTGGNGEAAEPHKTKSLRRIGAPPGHNIGLPSIHPY